MKINPLFLVLALAFFSCQNNEAENNNTGSNPKANQETSASNSSDSKETNNESLKQEEKKQAQNGERKNSIDETSPVQELKKPKTLYESVDIDNFVFANSPFASENHKADLLKTAYLKIDTAIYPHPQNRQLTDTLMYFYYDDQSEISLLVRGQENRIVYAAIVSNILPLKDNIAMGMNKESFWSSFPKMDNIHRDFNILRITNEDKLIWVGLQFQEDVLKILEYHGSNLD